MLAWLPDLAKWASVVAHHLKPGGLFYLLDIHPVSQVFDETTPVHAPEDLRIRYGYFPDSAGRMFPGNEPSYAGEGLIASPTWEWQHSLAEILGALLDAGLRLTSFDEHAVTMFEQFRGIGARRRWAVAAARTARFAAADLYADGDEVGATLVVARVGAVHELGTGRAGWPRVVAHPRLPQIRTCPTRASGSSNRGIATRSARTHEPPFPTAPRYLPHFR